MTTTSLLPHKPPPLKQRNNPAVFLRTNYYGSVGRPSSGKRKSAVELLEETKAFYVKSESVLDARQELKNADHLHVRSPTIDVPTMLRSPAPPIINGGGPFPFAMCLTCPPYPHQHFEHFDHYQIHHNGHNHHLSQGSLHQQQHHLNAGGNSSGPPSVESGGTASTGSTGGGGVTAITTLGRSGKQHQHSHNHHHHHHHHHNGSHHHTKSHRSSSTGSSGSRHLQENSVLSSALFFEPNFGSLTKTNTIGRTKRSVQPPGSLPVPKQTLSQLKKDSHNVLASLLPGMSFTLPAQSSLQKQTHHHHHHHHHHHPHQRQLLLQQQALASLSNSSSGALSLPSASSVATTVTNNPISTTATLAGSAANGLRSGGANGANTAAVASASLDKHSSLASTSNGSLALVITTSSSSAQQKTTGSLGQLSSSIATNVKASNHGVGYHRERNAEDDSPPPLPPKSPRITSKPARPHDFPQQLQLQVVDSSLEPAVKTGGNGSSNVPPPPPRRQSQKDSQAKYLRMLQEQSTNKLPHSVIDPTQSMTLPSPILPPTPPPDVVMESPMSDSGPIISPPPAFSTPVTPMIDRQNSTTSDKSGGGAKAITTGSITATTATGTNNSANGTGRLRSLSQSTSHYHNITGFSLASTIVPASTINGGGPPVINTSAPSKPHTQHHTSQQQQQQQHNHYHVPLSGTVSMSAISTVSGRTGSTRNNKSIPDLSSADVSSRFSPMSRSRSNSSPMSPEESIPASSPDDDDDPDEDPTSSSLADNGHDGDDDCSEKGQTSSLSPKIVLTGGMARRNSAKSYFHQIQIQPLQQSATLPKKLIPKSVTENFLYKVSNAGSTNVGIVETDTIKTSTIAAQTDGSQQQRSRNTTEAPSPARRPILRSKSDLSHRYAKAEKSGALASGFTLVHVDLGLPPPLPMHNSVSTNDFSINTTTSTTAGTLCGNHKPSHHHHHPQQQHIYSTPNSASKTLPLSSSTHGSHYHEPHSHNPHLSEGKRATKSAGDLERFFDMLGLDSTPTPAPCPLTELKDGSTAKTGSESPVFFSSVSSVDSAPRRSGSADSEDSPLDDKLGSRTMGGYGKFGAVGGPTITVQHGEPSIVERNARVIKWLFNCRKAMERR